MAGKGKIVENRPWLAAGVEWDREIRTFLASSIKPHYQRSNILRRGLTVWKLMFILEPHPSDVGTLLPWRKRG
jgi:hypothetical protein